jgi:hypothetical protein
MDTTMLVAFLDEMQKIAENTAVSASPANPAPVTVGAKPKSAMKPENKATSYTTVNTQVPPADFGAAVGAKSAPPPPVRT